MRRLLAIAVVLGTTLVGGSAAAAPASYRCMGVGGGLVACVDKAGNVWITRG